MPCWHESHCLLSSAHGVVFWKANLLLTVQACGLRIYGFAFLVLIVNWSWTEEADVPTVLFTIIIPGIVNLS